MAKFHNDTVRRSSGWSLLADHRAETRAIGEIGPALAAGALQIYVEERLNGMAGPYWLDGQPIDLAARACEMLGVILTAGTHVKLPDLSEAEWNQAGHSGSRYAAEGETGIRRTPALAVDRFDADGLRGGPREVLGRLYRWLQFNKNAEPTGEAGTNLFSSM